MQDEQTHRCHWPSTNTLQCHSSNKGRYLTALHYTAHLKSSLPCLYLFTSVWAICIQEFQILAHPLTRRLSVLAMCVCTSPWTWLDACLNTFNSWLRLCTHTLLTNSTNSRRPVHNLSLHQNCSTQYNIYRCPYSLGTHRTITQTSAADKITEHSVLAVGNSRNTSHSLFFLFLLLYAALPLPCQFSDDVVYVFVFPSL